MEKTRIILQEVTVEVPQKIQLDIPNFILEDSPPLLPDSLHLDDLSRLPLQNARPLYPPYPSLPFLPLIPTLPITLRSLRRDSSNFTPAHLFFPIIFYVFVILIRRKEILLMQAVERFPLVPSNLLLVEFLVDDVLLKGGVVEFWAGELEVVEPPAAELAGQDFKLVGDVADLIPQEAEQLVVHVALLEDLDEVVVLHLVQHRELQRLYLVLRAYLRDEVEPGQERRLSSPHFNQVHDFVVELKPIFPADVANFPLLQNHEVEVGVEVADDLLGVSDFDLEVLCEVVEGPIEEVPEEDQFLENLVVGLLEVLHPQCLGQLVHELLLFLVVEDLLEVRGLLDVVVYLKLQVFGHEVLVGQLLEYLELLTPLCIFTSEVRYNSTHAVDVVGHDDAAEGLDEDEANCLRAIGGDDVAEADSEHDVGSPVVGPDILLSPVGILYSFFEHPIGVGVDPGHGCEEDGDDVGDAEVDDKHFRKLPVLLVVDVPDEVNLKFLYLEQA